MVQVEAGNPGGCGHDMGRGQSDGMGFQLGVGLGDMVSMEGGLDIIRAVGMSFSWRVWPRHGTWSDLVGVVMGKGWAV